MRSECSMWNTLFFCVLCLNIFILCSAFFADMCYNKTIENRTGESLKHESEEKKMAENTKDFSWIMTVKNPDARGIDGMKIGIEKEVE